MSLSHLGLDAFEAIAELGTIVLAAERLGVTQTALTQRIKSLEAELETPLFLRSRKGMALTQEGRILLQYCTDRRYREELTVRKIKGLTSGEPYRVRITGPTLQTEKRILSVLPRLRKAWPHLTFTFDIDDSGDLFRKLRENMVDLVLTSSLPHPSVKYKALGENEFILVGPYEWRKREVKEIISTEPIIDFNTQDPYTIEFLKSFRLLPRHLPERIFINNTHQMLGLVKAGLGYAVFDQDAVASYLRARELTNLLPGTSQKAGWYLCWSDQGENLSPPLRAVIEAVE